MAARCVADETSHPLILVTASHSRRYGHDTGGGGDGGGERERIAVAVAG